MLGPFETQRRTEWFRNMRLASKYPGRRWHHKALHALQDLARPGDEFTAFEMVKMLEPVIGRCESRNDRLEFSRTGCKIGLLEKTDGTRRNTEGKSYPSPIYRVKRNEGALEGYMESVRRHRCS